MEKRCPPERVKSLLAPRLFMACATRRPPWTAVFSSTWSDVAIAAETTRSAEDPGVLGAASLGRVDDQGAALQRDPREAAGGDLVAVGVGAQVDVTWLEPAVAVGRMGREVDRLLGDVVLRRLAGEADHLLSLLRGRLPADHHSPPSQLGPRLHNHLIDPLEDLLALLLDRHVVGGDRRDDRLLAEVEADQLLGVGVGELVVADAGAEG